VIALALAALPSRRSLALVALAVTIGAATYACGGAIRELDELHDPADDAALARCRREGRAAKEAGAAPIDAYGSYEACKRDAGLP
jgi:hypothetical protein